MEQTVAPAPQEQKHTFNPRHMVGLATLGLTAVACKASDIFASPDPVFSFARGAVGTALIEAEAGMGKLLNFGLNGTSNVPLGCLSIATVAVPPVVIGALSVEYPFVGYAAIAIPLLVAFIHVTARN